LSLVKVKQKSLYNITVHMLFVEQPEISSLKTTSFDHCFKIYYDGIIL